MLISFDRLVQRHHIKPYGILHLGANTGQEAEIYVQHGVQVTIWIEALPELRTRLFKHVTKFPQMKSHVVTACVAEEEGQIVTFHVASNGAQSSSMLELGTHKKEHPTVRYVRDVCLETRRVDRILEELWVIEHQRINNGEWMVCVDLQGAELAALRSMGTYLGRFEHAYVEVNERELYVGCPMVSEIDAYLAEFGFKPKEVKMTGCGWGDKFYSKL